MNKYINLLRLPDQYAAISSALASALYLHSKNILIFYWSIGVFCISVFTFAINELVDREDVDKLSWNPIHVKKENKLNMRIVFLIFSFFIIVGLFFSYLSKLLISGLLMFLLAVLYSVKPARFKGRFCIDILTQISMAVIIPFVSPIILFGKLSEAYIFTILIASMIWALLMPYQLADFTADKKVNFKNTHVVLGMKNSLYFGLILLLFSLVFYFYFNIYIKTVWTIPLVFFALYGIYKYIKWIKLKTIKSQEISMQNYVRLVKPISQLFLPYILVWLFLL